MPEPPTHYQLSFTSRQAMALFVGLLLALGAAYFLGVLTGLASRPTGNGNAGADLAPTPEPTKPEQVAAAVPSPSPIRPIRTARIPAFPRPVLGREPTAAPNLQFFEDRAQSEATAPPQAPATPKPAASSSPSKGSTSLESGGFWVQVVSVTSEREARARRDKLIHHGYRARVLVGEGPRGRLYRVRVGPYPSREEASRASDRLSREERVKTWIAPPGR